jgi:hypothetical protein
MSMIDVIQQRLQTTMMRFLESNMEPVPMLGFCRGEVDLGVISGPKMPSEPAARFEVYQKWSAFMSLYGATEAVMVADLIRTYWRDGDPFVNPNSDPGAETFLHYVRVPSGRRYTQDYHLDDYGLVVWHEIEDRGIGEELVVQFLRSAMGWAPVDQFSRENGPYWLQRQLGGGVTVGLQPAALS